MRLPGEPFGQARKRTTILVVDDDPSVRSLVVRFLQAAGYRVIQAENGVEALDHARQDAEIDLLLTDVVMPLMNGVELAAELRRERPGTRCLFMSAYPGDQTLGETAGREASPVIAKPFTPKDLIARVRAALTE